MTPLRMSTSILYLFCLYCFHLDGVLGRADVAGELQCTLPTSSGDEVCELYLGPDYRLATDGVDFVQFECHELDQMDCPPEQYTWSINGETIENDHPSVKIVYDSKKGKSVLQITELTYEWNGANTVTCSVSFSDARESSRNACLAVDMTSPPMSLSLDALNSLPSDQPITGEQPSPEPLCMFPAGSLAETCELHLGPDYRLATDGIETVQFECHELDSVACPPDEYIWRIGDEIVDDNHPSIQILYDSKKGKSIIQISGLTHEWNGAHTVTCTVSFSDGSESSQNACLAVQMSPPAGLASNNLFDAETTGEPQCTFPTGGFSRSCELHLGPEHRLVTDGTDSVQFECQETDPSGCPPEQLVWRVNGEIIGDDHETIKISFQKGKSVLEVTELSYLWNGAHTITCTANFSNGRKDTKNACLVVQMTTPSTTPANPATTERIATTNSPISKSNEPKPATRWRSTDAPRSEKITLETDKRPVVTTSKHHPTTTLPSSVPAIGDRSVPSAVWWMTASLLTVLLVIIVAVLWVVTSRRSRSGNCTLKDAHGSDLSPYPGTVFVTSVQMTSPIASPNDGSKAGEIYKSTNMEAYRHKTFD